MFPSAPVIGDSMVPSIFNPSVDANSFTLLTAFILFPSSLTIPPLPTSPRPTSN